MITPKELSPFPWKIGIEQHEDWEDVSIDCARGLPIENADYDHENREAMVTAVNATYGKGINPEGVEGALGSLTNLLGIIDALSREENPAISSGHFTAMLVQADCCRRNLSACEFPESEGQNDNP